MIEAEITCECASITLADLQVALTKGMVVYLDATRARSSQDLQRAVRAKGITVKYVQRYREQRPQVTTPVPQAPMLQMETPEKFVSPVDEEAIAQRVVALLTPQLQALLEAVQALGNGVVASTGMSSLSSHGSSRTVGTVVVDDVPVFIPSKIGRDDLRPNLSVAAEGTEDGGGVTDALAALKAARKGKLK